MISPRVRGQVRASTRLPPRSCPIGSVPIEYVTAGLPAVVRRGWPTAPLWINAFISTTVGS